VLRIVEEPAGDIPLDLFSHCAEVSASERLRRTNIPLPPGPVVLRSVLFTLFCSIAYWLTGQRRSFTISTEGTFPFCDLCYAHFCHRVYLREHRAAIGGRRLRWMARILNHAWASVMERIAFRSAKIIVVPSEGLARELRRAYPELVPGKILVISNPVAVPPLPDGAVITPGRDTLRISFCALGNFERKGLRLILEALGRVPDLDVQLTVIGGTPSEIADYLIADDRVRFVGFQSDVWPYLADSDVFVFPSDFMKYFRWFVCKPPQRACR
jgi:glycosyltransferase involved in cell wall biosynthesis